MIETFPYTPDKRDDAREERFEEKHERFMDITMSSVRSYLTRFYPHFTTLSSGEKNKIVNDFLVLEYPKAYKDFHTKLKVEIFKRL